jgi:Flp pilus assembly CpaE family ATPase
MELRKAREILDELRRRAGEPARPPLERDYIERLLPQF